MIFFSGYWSDASTLLITLSQLTQQPEYKRFDKLPVMGGDGLYGLVYYPTIDRPDFSRLHFTAFASPDEWDFLCRDGETQACHTPNFFYEYKLDFDPYGKWLQNTYGYNLPDADTMLSYDATNVLVKAYQNALITTHQAPAPTDLQKALTMITGNHSIQGVSGQISFGPDGDPINKSVVVVDVDPTTSSVRLVSVKVSDSFLKSP